MSMSSQSADTISERLAVGATVITADGESFATVKSVQGGYFELDVPMGRDFWLSCVYVESADSRNVQLNITRPEVDEHRLSAPGIEAAEDANQASTADRVISNEEALSQRERMERQLAEQRERLARERGGTV